MLAAALALLTSLCYGVSNYVGPAISRDLPTYPTLIAGQVVAFAASGAVVLATASAVPDGAVLLAALGAGVGNAWGLIAFYRAATLGPLSIVTPIGSLAVIIPVTVGLVQGEPVGALKVAGFVLAVGGVALAARRPATAPAADIRGAVVWALTAAVGFGGFLWLLAPRLDGGVFWAVLASRAAVLTVMVGAAFALSAPLRAPLNRLPLLAVPGLLLFAGTLAYSAATRHGRPQRRVRARLAVPRGDRRARVRGRRAGEPGAGPRRRRRAGRDRARQRRRIVTVRRTGFCPASETVSRTASFRRARTSLRPRLVSLTFTFRVVPAGTVNFARPSATRLRFADANAFAVTAFSVPAQAVGPVQATLTANALPPPPRGIVEPPGSPALDRGVAEPVGGAGDPPPPPGFTTVPGTPWIGPGVGRLLGREPARDERVEHVVDAVVAVERRQERLGPDPVGDRRAPRVERAVARAAHPGQPHVVAADQVATYAVFRSQGEIKTTAPFRQCPCYEASETDRGGLMSRVHAGGRLLATLIAAGMLVPAAAAAAPAKPAVTTGGAADVAQSTATLKGSVDPNERATQYYFEYGTTSLYGAKTAATDAGKGARRVAVTAAIGALAPATRYHYRLVASNSRGATKGKDRTFKTKRQPLGLSLAATPNPVSPGGTSVLAGNLSGTGNAGRDVVLQSNPFPYTQGFLNASNAQVTDASGNFSFPVLNIGLNTQYRVLMPQNQTVQSPIVAVGVAPKVSAGKKRVRRTARGAIYRFRGKITPAADGSEVAIQRLRKGKWSTISGTVARHTDDGFSRYSKRVRLARGGRFRVYAGITNGRYVPNTSRTLRIKLRR